MRATTGRTRATVDGIGVLLLTTYIVLAFVAARHGGDPGPLVALLLASAVAIVVGRLLGAVDRAVLPAVVVVAAVIVAVAADSLVAGGPLAGPFGYRNATGAFCVQVVVAGLMFAAAVRPWPLRIIGISAAILFAVFAAIDSSAAGLSLLAIAVATIGFAGVRAVRASIIASATLFLVTLVAVIALGASYRAGASGPLVRALSERRLVLWNESLRIVGEQPGGVGPGRFQDVSPTAIRDVDAHWAHQEFLQQGVELGWAGLVLLLLMFVWGFARLWVHPEPDMVVALGAAALAALGIHASVDYVLHFAAVPLTAAALIGTAQAAPSRRFRRDRDEHREEGVEGGADPLRVAGASTSG